MPATCASLKTALNTKEKVGMWISAPERRTLHVLFHVAPHTARLKALHLGEHLPTSDPGNHGNRIYEYSPCANLPLDKMQTATHQRARRTREKSSQAFFRMMNNRKFFWSQISSQCGDDWFFNALIGPFESMCQWIIQPQG
mmetsp:Transcript_3517/g.22106  ORF Transcript_3517/g.22106 Transcript_3517/m.22106 type:complete len:141 (-) Transcript_3517:2468-2890(-)